MTMKKLVVTTKKHCRDCCYTEDDKCTIAYRYGIDREVDEAILQMCKDGGWRQIRRHTALPQRRSATTGQWAEFLDKR
jgi:hypothetical protein